MFDPSEEVAWALRVVKDSLPGPTPAAAIILGSGLGGLTSRGGCSASLAYGDIPGMPVPTVSGHEGSLSVLELGDGGGRFLCFSGRAHLYEGHPAQRLGMAVRIAAALGVGTLVATCAAGSLRAELPTGRLVLVTDHINTTGTNPLVGVTPPSGSERFPDTVGLYSPDLAEAARAAASELAIILASGVYAWVTGPAYETPAEALALAGSGADIIGMSLVPETLTAAQLGMRVLAIACVTNEAHGLGGGAVRHEDVLRVARRQTEQLASLLEALAPRLAGG